MTPHPSPSFRRVFRFLTVFLISCSTVVSGQWTLLDGPYGSMVNELVVKDNFLFAGTYTGVYRSSDKGVTWQNTSLGENFVSAMTVIGDDLFATALSNGMFVSHDNGDSWNQLSIPALRLAAIDNNLVAQTPNGIFISSDSGNSWEFISNGLTSTYISAFEGHDGTLFVGTEEGLFTSNNYGSSWLLSDATPNVTAIVIHNNTIFATSSGGRIIRSSDSGATWNLLEHDFTFSIYTAIWFNNALWVGTAGDGVHYSTDEGETWTKSVSSPTNLGILTFAYIDNSLFIGTAIGVSVTNDFGTSWTAANHGISSPHIKTLKQKGNSIWTITGGGLFISTDRTQSWSIKTNGLDTDLTAFTSIDDHLFVGCSHGVSRSDDNGGTWNWIDSPMNNYPIVGFDTLGNILYVTTVGGGTFKSSDLGQTWGEVIIGVPSINTNLTINGDRLLMGTPGDGTFTSMNGGATWTEINNGLTDLNIGSIAAVNDSLYYLSSNSGIFVTNNRGASWSKETVRTINPSATHFLEYLLSNDTSIFAITFEEVDQLTTGRIFHLRKNLQWEYVGPTYPEHVITSLLIFNGDLLAGKMTGLYSISLPGYPIIDSINPLIGHSGTNVSIAGQNFGQNSTVSVEFNGVPATISSFTETTIDVSVPEGVTTGPIKITVDGRSRISKESFVVRNPIHDQDGNAYDTVQIGNQTWFTENLNTTHYNDGTEIPLVESQSEWSVLTTPAYSWYDNDIGYKNQYGALYNGYAVETGKLCPSGWHVPTNDDWNELVDYLGGPSIAGSKLKEAGMLNWQAPNSGATNESGFSALPGGLRNEDNFHSIGLTGHWWSSTEFEPNYAWSQGLHYNEESMLAPPGYSYNIGLSVRCIKTTLITCSPTSSIDLISACTAFQWIDGNTYTDSNNTASFTLINKAGCDSLVTLNLTIKKSTASTHTVSACESFTWIDGHTYTDSNNSATITLTNKAGCDSLVTLNLTIKKNTASTHTVSACESFTWVDGHTYTDSNNSATITLTNKAGCDSLVTLDLTIKKSTASTQTVSACESYTWIDGNTYTTSNNTATFTLTNKVGCDSLVSLNLTISNVDASVSTALAPILAANANNATYEWVDCETENPIPNETAQNFTPTMSGNYAVRVTKNGCHKTSACFPIVIAAASYEYRVRLFPNPTDSDITILFDERFHLGQFTVIDQMGHSLTSQELDQSGSVKVSLNAPPGLYFIILKAKGGLLTYLKVSKH